MPIPDERTLRFRISQIKDNRSRLQEQARVALVNYNKTRGELLELATKMRGSSPDEIQKLKSQANFLAKMMNHWKRDAEKTKRKLQQQEALLPRLQRLLALSQKQN